MAERSKHRRRVDTDVSVAAVLLVVVGAYLFTFVSRGWVPHDEGTLGQSAERVLAGQVPHVHYNELYTGLLSWIYAGLFAVMGVDLVFIRWLLYLVAIASTAMVYLLARRFGSPAAAAFTACIALTWSFPNYFAGLPSWWLLACTLLALWCLFRQCETGQVRYAAAAGIVIGLAVLIKQTALYLVIALILSLLYRGQVIRLGWPRLVSPHPLPAIAGLGAVGAVMILLRHRLVGAELVYLVLPVFVTVLPLLLPDGFGSERTSRAALAPVALAALGVALPVTVFAGTYAVSGNAADLFRGTLVAPLERLVGGSKHMPPLWLLAWGLALPTLVIFCNSRRVGPPGPIIGWIALAGVVSASFNFMWAYHLIWQAARAMAVVLPVAVLFLLSNQRLAPERRRVLLAVVAMLTCGSLVQYPFAGAIYFCYVMPLVALVALAVFAVDVRLVAAGRQMGAAALAFSLFVLNRGDVYSLGRSHRLAPITAELGLERATLRVNRDDAAVYARVIDLVRSHLGAGLLLATPDCPELYFLAGRFSPGGEILEFLDTQRTQSSLSMMADADVVVMNHGPHFSPPLNAAFIASVRSSYPQGERVGAFEVRWRAAQQVAATPVQ